MKESIYENEFSETFIDSENSIYGYRWKSTNIDMTPEQYKAEMTRHASNISQYTPQFVLVDFRESEFIIDPDLQSFVSETLFQSMLDVGTKKLAVIQTPDYIMQLSIEQTVNEQKDSKYITQYFSDTEEAQMWFLNNE